VRRVPGTLAAAAVAGSIALSPAPPAAVPERRTIRLHYGPAERDRGRYQYVPVTIAAGTTRLEIAYRYDKADGANAVDLGLFEPGPLTLGTRALRGWSGGARDRALVAVGEATPGYWPGALPAGEWHVALGLYKVAPAGVEVELTVETSPAPTGPTPGLGPRPREPLRRGEAWYSGDLHVHTLHSDGSQTASAVAAAAREAGLPRSPRPRRDRADRRRREGPGRALLHQPSRPRVRGLLLGARRPGRRRRGGGVERPVRPAASGDRVLGPPAPAGPARHRGGLERLASLPRSSRPGKRPRESARAVGGGHPARRARGPRGRDGRRPDRASDPHRPRRHRDRRRRRRVALAGGRSGRGRGGRPGPGRRSGRADSGRRAWGRRAPHAPARPPASGSTRRPAAMRAHRSAPQTARSPRSPTPST